MRIRTLAWTAGILCATAALASVLVEATGWHDIDAGTSWTLAPIVACALALVNGGLTARRRTSLKDVLLAPTVLAGAVLLPLALGFALMGLGVAVPWRAAGLDPLLAIPVVWLQLLVLGLTGLLVGKVAAWLSHRLRRTVPAPAA